jgi:hypothetical protein
MYSLVSTRSFFFRGLGIFIVLIWTSTVVLYLAVHLYSTSLNVSSVVPKLPAYWRQIILVALTGALFGIGAVVPSVVEARTLLFKVVSPTAFITDAILVPGIWFLSLRFIKKRSTVK